MSAGQRLEIEGITRRCPGAVALDGARAQAQHLHAVLGENEAGKSTRTTILAGDIQPSKGEIHVKGQPRRFLSGCAFSLPEPIASGQLRPLRVPISAADLRMSL